MTFENKANLPEKLLKPYNPADVEESIYKTWEESGFFNPDVCVEKGITDAGAETFTMIMPPPNANGRLHAGHALDSTLKDITARFERMRGKRVLMVPGSDHAGFETQGVYEKELQKQGINEVPQIKMDFKDYGIGAQILHDIDISKLKLITNTFQNKRVGMIGYGLEITDYINY